MNIEKLEGIRKDLEIYLNQKGGMRLYDLYASGNQKGPLIDIIFSIFDSESFVLEDGARKMKQKGITTCTFEVFLNQNQEARVLLKKLGVLPDQYRTVFGSLIDQEMGKIENYQHFRAAVKKQFESYMAQNISHIDLTGMQEEMRKKTAESFNWCKPVIKVESVIEKNGQYIAKFTFLPQSLFVGGNQPSGWHSYGGEEVSQDYLFGELKISPQLVEYLQQKAVYAEPYNSHESKAIYEGYFEDVHAEFKRNIPSNIAVKSIPNPKLRMMAYFLENYSDFFQCRKTTSRNGTPRYADITFKNDYNVNFTYKNNRLLIEFELKTTFARGSVFDRNHVFRVPVKKDLPPISSISFEDVEDLSVYLDDRVGDMFIRINELLPTVWGAREGGMTAEDAEKFFQNRQGIFPYLSRESSPWWQRVHLLKNLTGTAAGIIHHRICYIQENGLFTLDGELETSWRTFDGLLSYIEQWARKGLSIIKPEESSFLIDDELLPNIWGAKEGGMTAEDAEKFFQNRQGIFPRLSAQKPNENKPWWQRIRLVVNHTGTAAGIKHYLIDYIPAQGFTLRTSDEKKICAWTLDGLLSNIDRVGVFSTDSSVIKPVVEDLSKLKPNVKFHKDLIEKSNKMPRLLHDDRHLQVHEKESAHTALSQSMHQKSYDDVFRHSANNNNKLPRDLIDKLIKDKFAISEIDKETVNNMLTNKPVGSFIVSKDKAPNILLFSVVTLSGTIENFQIDYQNELDKENLIVDDQALYKRIHRLIHDNIGAHLHLVSDYPTFTMPGYKDLRAVLQKQQFYTEKGNLDHDYNFKNSKKHITSDYANRATQSGAEDRHSTPSSPY